ncbi:hypothetical protein Cadr_000016733 [Camelus dromedarius]|uniref:Uncharacterized protein n=1 Tax=Camelus dromedarius TaxID=9838 RepID=A0A5N4DGF1_CAMDR|nr:hypothetical protein Cadr_000016733 [Camelus dromedarius]
MTPSSDTLQLRVDTCGRSLLLQAFQLLNRNSSVKAHDQKEHPYEDFYLSHCAFHFHCHAVAISCYAA